MVEMAQGMDVESRCYDVIKALELWHVFMNGYGLCWIKRKREHTGGAAAVFLYKADRQTGISIENHLSHPGHKLTSRDGPP